MAVGWKEQKRLDKADGKEYGAALEQRIFGFRVSYRPSQSGNYAQDIHSAAPDFDLLKDYFDATFYPNNKAEIDKILVLTKNGAMATPCIGLDPSLKQVERNLEAANPGYIFGSRGAEGEKVITQKVECK